MGQSKEVLGAYFRQGLHELGAALYGPGTVARHPEYGMIGTKPPSMVVDGLREDSEATPSPTRDDIGVGPSQLDAHMQQAQDQSVPEPQPEPERDIERD